MNPMKKSSLIAAMVWILANPLASCKKFIEQQEQNAVVKLVTQGTWRVTGYYDHQSVNLTDSFSGYSFQFNDNGTVYGTRYGQQSNGTYTVDISSKSITSDFPTAPYPVSLLNHTWTITDSYTDSVAAKTPVDSSFNILNLHKN